MPSRAGPLPAASRTTAAVTTVLPTSVSVPVTTMTRGRAAARGGDDGCPAWPSSRRGPAVLGGHVAMSCAAAATSSGERSARAVTRSREMPSGTLGGRKQPTSTPRCRQREAGGDRGLGRRPSGATGRRRRPDRWRASRRSPRRGARTRAASAGSRRDDVCRGTCRGRGGRSEPGVEDEAAGGVDEVLAHRGRCEHGPALRAERLAQRHRHDEVGRADESQLGHEAPPPTRDPDAVGLVDDEQGVVARRTPRRGRPAVRRPRARSRSTRPRRRRVSPARRDSSRSRSAGSEWAKVACGTRDMRAASCSEAWACASRRISAPRPLSAVRAPRLAAYPVEKASALGWPVKPAERRPRARGARAGCR